MRVDRPVGVGLLLGGALLMAACTSTPAAQDSTSPVITTATPSASARPSPTPVASSQPPASTIVSTVTQHQGGSTIMASPPPSTAEPAPVDGECPFLSDDAMAGITGQRGGQTQISATKPYPICTFYRSDGGYRGSVRIVVAATPQAAIAAVDQHVPRDQSYEATKPAGWSGGLLTNDKGEAIYAVSKGKIAVIATENETPSIKARNMAECAIYGAKLEPGPAPEYCSGPQG